MNKNNLNQRFAVFVLLLSIIALILGGGIMALRITEATARIEEAKAQQIAVQPEIIVARSQANINNSVALTNVKDSALLVVLVIMIAKSLFDEKRKP